MECPHCHFAVGNEVTVGSQCPNCERPFRNQPTPLHDEMEIRDMPAPGEDDMGGNPLQEGILGDYQNAKNRDQSFARVAGPVEQCPNCGLNLESSYMGNQYCNHCQREWSDEEIINAHLVPGLMQFANTYGENWEPLCPHCGTETIDWADKHLCTRCGYSEPNIETLGPTAPPVDQIAGPHPLTRGLYAKKDDDEEEIEPDIEVPAEIVGVLPPDPESLRSNKRRSSMERLSFLPLLGAAAARFLPSIAGSLIGNSLADTALGAVQPPEGQQMQVQGPEYYSSTEAPDSHFFGADEFKSPSSTDRIMGDKDDDYDTKQHDDGEHKPLDAAQDVNDIGGSDQGFSEEATTSFEQLLPKILDLALSEGKHGADDPDIRALHEQLDAEVPGYLDQADDKAALEFIEILKGEQAKHPDHKQAAAAPAPLPIPGLPDPANANPHPLQNKCGVCGGTTTPGAPCAQCGSASPQKFAADSQGPHTDEQRAAVAELLIADDRAGEVPQMILNPQDYADELAQITQQDTPPQGPQEGRPAPPVAPPPPGGGMPMPGMQAPGGGSAMGMPGMMAAIYHHGATVDNIAQKCPNCGSHTTGLTSEAGDQECRACGEQWADELLKDPKLSDYHVQEHGDHFDNGLGIDAADVIHQENHEQEQDSSHTWADEAGEPLKVGQEYEMYSDNYDIPDMVRIEAVKPDSIEYTLTGEYGITHQTEISQQEAAMENLRFVPGHGEGENPNDSQNMDDVARPAPGMDQTDLSTPHAYSHTASEETGPSWIMDGVRTAGAAFTPTQQRDFIDEDGVARNADKLDLVGTHYESRVDVADDQFLFGL